MSHTIYAAKFEQTIIHQHVHLRREMVFSSVRQTSVSAGGIIVAMHIIPPVAKTDGVY
jgi:hypothetical protein